MDSARHTQSQRRSRGDIRIRPISQVVLDLRVPDLETGFGDVRTRTLDWISRRAGGALPAEAWKGDTFELQDVGAQRTGAIALDKPRYWGARADDADKQVAQRTWTTEFGIGILASKLLYGCRLQCVTQGDDAPYMPSIPSVVRRVVREFDARIDDFRVQEKAWFLDDQEETDQFIRLLLSNARKYAVIAISQSRNSGDEWRSNAAESANDLAFRLIGAAHVVVVSERASYALTDALGREFSVFNGAVRTYKTGFNPNRDEPAHHPIALPASIASWPAGGFLEFLVMQSLRLSVSGQDVEAELPSFSSLRSVAIKQRREAAGQSGKSDAELLELAMSENELLRKQREEEQRTSDGLLEAAEQERDTAVEERDEARNEVRKLRERVEHLLDGFRAKGRSEEVEIPGSLDKLEPWADRYLSGAVVLLNRAIRAAKKSDFEDVGLVYRTLLILRDSYVPMRRGGDAAQKKAYEAALAEQGLEESPSFAGAGAGRHGDEYFVSFGGRRRELERHIKGSNSREQRFGFRLYFFWDEQSQQAIVGWLPGHLTTGVS